MAKKYIDEMLEYIGHATSAYQAVAEQKRMLLEAGFRELNENDDYNIELGGRYFAVRGSSAIIAFTVPESIPEKISIMASHSDMPSFKIKNFPDMKVEGAYVKLNVEPYGGAIYSTWFDRPLSASGRIFVSTSGDDENADATYNGGMREILVDINQDILMIPSLAIHLDRDMNKGHSIDAQKELLPVLSLDENAEILDFAGRAAGVKPEDIVSFDLFLYNRENPVKWGANNEFVSTPRLDDAACAFASIKALIDVGSAKSGASDAIRVHAMFNNEEVGSSSRCGACSTFLSDTLERIAASLGMYGVQYQKMLASGLMLSADNAHGFHPNYPEKYDPTNHVYLGRGVALKFSGNQKYTTDAQSAAATLKLAKKAGTELQNFHNNSNIAGGSTLGNLLVHSVPVLCADVGIPQLAMHSVYETCAISDAEDMYKLAKALFE